MPRSGSGASLAYTLAGPPDKINPLGAMAANSLAGVSYRTITEYTLHSRILRAMTCVYCDPKSKMTSCSVMVFRKTETLVLANRFGERKMSGNRRPEVLLKSGSCARLQPCLRKGPRHLCRFASERLRRAGMFTDLFSHRSEAA